MKSSTKFGFPVAGTRKRTRTRPAALRMPTTRPAAARRPTTTTTTTTRPATPRAAPTTTRTTNRRVAALYVDRVTGPYAHYSHVDLWDWARDARLYSGPDPIVAHPACGPWGRFYWNYKGGEGDLDCGLYAVDQVRRNGGVLEHPKDSGLWYNRPAGGPRGTAPARPGVETLPRPSDCEPPKPKPPQVKRRRKRRKCPDDWGGYTIEVNQVDWGHKAKKPTWLYIVGVPRNRLPPFPEPRQPTHLMTTFTGGLPEVPKKERHITPVGFAEWLLQVAQRVEMP